MARSHDSHYVTFQEVVEQIIRLFLHGEEVEERQLNGLIVYRCGGGEDSKHSFRPRSSFEIAISLRISSHSALTGHLKVTGG